MTEDELKCLIAGTDPRRRVTPELAAASRAVVEVITATPRRAGARADRPGAGRRVRGDVAVVWGVAAAATAVLVVVLVTVNSTGGEQRSEIAAGGPATASEVEVTPGAPPVGSGAREYADAGPHLLVGLPGWAVVRLHSDDELTGEMRFAGPGGGAVDLHWRPAAEHEAWVGQAREAPQVHPPISITGYEAEVHGVPGTNEYVAVWSDGVHSLTLRGSTHEATSTAFADLASSLHAATPEEWIAALPASTIGPPAQGDVIAEMLQDVPLPPGHDPSTLGDPTVSLDRYQLGAQVAGGVACGWIEEWIDARGVGDTARQQAAVDALSTARTWPVLIDMQADGAYPEVLWEYADAIAGDGTVIGGRPLTVEESYADALGC